ncbi:hypothetical protein U1Q18_033189 [Sarracenia purpurea var. burkii]
MSVFWLVPQLVLAGVGEAFHFPGNATLFYQEFPTSLKSTSTALVAMFFGLAFFLSTGVVGLVRRATSWLPNNINQGRMDNVYWVLFGLGYHVYVGYQLLSLAGYKVLGESVQSFKGERSKMWNHGTLSGDLSTVGLSFCSL